MATEGEHVLCLLIYEGMHDMAVSHLSVFMIRPPGKKVITILSPSVGGKGARGGGSPLACAGGAGGRSPSRGVEDELYLFSLGGDYVSSCSRQQKGNRHMECHAMLWNRKQHNTEHIPTMNECME